MVYIFKVYNIVTNFSILNPKDIFTKVHQNNFYDFGGITQEKLLKEFKSTHKKPEQQQMMINIYFQSVQQTLLHLQNRINILQKKTENTSGVYGVILEDKIPGLIKTYDHIANNINTLQQKIIDAKEGEAKDLIQEFQTTIHTLMEFSEQLKEFES